MTTIILNTQAFTSTVSTATNYISNGDFDLSGKITISSIEDKMTISSTNYIETIALNGIEYQNEDLTQSGFNSFSIDGKKLLSVLKAAKSDVVKLEIKDDEVVIKIGRSKVKIKTINELHKFVITNNIGTPVSIGKLNESLQRVLHAVDSNNPKFELNGVCITSKKGVLNLVGTDTRRLSVYTAESNENEFEAIVPKDGIKSIIKLFGGYDITAHIQDTELTVTTENISYSVKLVNGTFPQWERIVPEAYNQTFSIDRKKLQELIAEASLFQPEIEIKINDNLIVIKDMEGNTETREDIDTDNVNIHFRINAKNILEFLSSYNDENVQICFNGQNLPIILVADSNFKEVCMPIVVSEEEIQDETRAA